MQSLLKRLVAKESDDLTQAKRHVASTAKLMMTSLLILSLFALALFLVIGRLMANMMKQKRDYDEAQLTLLKQEQRMSQARKEVVEVVAHDLKNPLATIKMSLDLMLEDVASGTNAADLKEGVLIAQRSTDAMERLIKGILDHAKIESGQLVLEKKEINLATVIEELVARRANPSPQSQRFTNDASQIQRPLFNL